MLRASRGKRAPQNIRPEGNYFISQILGSKAHQKSKNGGTPNWCIRKDNFFIYWSYIVVSIKYSECCQKLFDTYSDDLKRNLFTELKQFHSFIFNINLVQQKLDSVMLNKVIVEDNIECAFPNVEISLRLFLALIVTNWTTECPFS